MYFRPYVVLTSLEKVNKRKPKVEERPESLHMVTQYTGHSTNSCNRLLNCVNHVTSTLHSPIMDSYTDVELSYVIAQLERC